jgi:hypothetical protein
MPGEEKLILYDVKSKHEGVSCRFACMSESRSSRRRQGVPTSCAFPCPKAVHFVESKAVQEDPLYPQLQEDPV